MQYKFIISAILVFGFFIFIIHRFDFFNIIQSPGDNFSTNSAYWFILHRKSKQEFLYFGNPGDTAQSRLVKKFKVNTGKLTSPTPLHDLLSRGYWLVTSKATSTNPETAPYFISLDVPVTDEAPFGPDPYPECSGKCDWELPGEFGLHGVNGNENKLFDLGSSGCIRHSDSDITYLYNLLDPEKMEIRYYIKDI